jgi:integrase
MAKAGHSADLQRKVLELLRRFLKFLVRRKVLRDNVAQEVHPPKAEQEEMHPLSEDEIPRFLDAASAVARNHYALFVTAIDSGMRQGELLALECSDLDWETGIVDIKRTVQLHNGKHRVKELKTKASRRRLRLTPSTVALLKAERQNALPGCPLVFASRRGGHIQREVIRRAMMRALKIADLPHIRFHDLRHTCATILLARTKDIKAVSARLGHKDIRVTYNRYCHVVPSMEEELVVNMQQILGKNGVEMAADAPEYVI